MIILIVKSSIINTNMISALMTLSDVHIQLQLAGTQTLYKTDSTVYETNVQYTSYTTIMPHLWSHTFIKTQHR